MTYNKPILFRVFFYKPDSGKTYHTDVVAIDREAAQEVAIEKLEAMNITHDTITHITEL